MPSIFKALASISAWILFGSGCVGIVTSSVRRITMGEAVAETALVASGQLLLLALLWQ